MTFRTSEMTQVFLIAVACSGAESGTAAFGNIARNADIAKARFLRLMYQMICQGCEVKCRQDHSTLAVVRIPSTMIST